MSASAAAVQIPIAQGLVLDHETHIYRWNGLEVPGVTRVLGDAKLLDYSGIPQHILDNAAARGKAAHLALEYLDRGTLDRETLDSQLQPYIHAYEAFCADSGFVAGLAERSRYNRQRDYAGTFDRTGVIGNQAIVLDFKTGEVQPGHFAQLCAYAHFQQDPRRFRLIGLQLKNTGRYQVHEVPVRQFEYWSSTFFCALHCAQVRMSERKGR